MTTNKKINRRTNRIQSAIRDFFVGLAFFFTFIFVVGFTTSECETKYRMDGTVYSVTGEEIIIEDSTGNLWLLFDDGFQVGEKVRVTFFNNYTDYTREDDEILKVKRLDKSKTK